MSGYDAWEDSYDRTDYDESCSIGYDDYENIFEYAKMDEDGHLVYQDSSDYQTASKKEKLRRDSFSSENDEHEEGTTEEEDVPSEITSDSDGDSDSNPFDCVTDDEVEVEIENERKISGRILSVQEIYMKRKIDADKRRLMKENQNKYSGPLQECHEAIKDTLTWAEKFVPPTPSDCEIPTSKIVMERIIKQKFSNTFKRETFSHPVGTNLGYSKLSPEKKRDVVKYNPILVGHPYQGNTCFHTHIYPRAIDPFTRREKPCVDCVRELNELKLRQGPGGEDCPIAPLHKTKLCAAVRMGTKCIYGNKCDYNHDENEVSKILSDLKIRQGPGGADCPSSPKNPTILCGKVRANLICPYGKNCEFSHNSKAFFELLQGPGGPQCPECPQYEYKLCRYVRANEECPHGKRCDFSHDFHVLTTPRWPDKLCNYVRNGIECVHGDRCFYNHDINDVLNRAEKSKPVDDKRDTVEESMPRKRPVDTHNPINPKLLFCKYFPDCKMGESCKFAHDKKQIEKIVQDCARGSNCPRIKYVITASASGYENVGKTLCINRHPVERISNYVERLQPELKAKFDALKKSPKRSSKKSPSKITKMAKSEHKS